MGRSPCCSKEGLNRGAWTSLEDKILTAYIKAHGEGKWRNLPKRAGLKRCGKSCRLRWLNYLRPDIKRGNISHDEEELIIRLHKLLGNRWSLIAGRLPGRTDNEIKNYWNTTLRKRARPQSSLPPSNKSHPSKSRVKRPATESKTTDPPLAAATQPQPIRTKAFKCTKVLVPAALLPPNENHLTDSTTINSAHPQAHQNRFDNLKVDYGNEELHATFSRDANFYHFGCDEVQASNDDGKGNCSYGNNFSMVFDHSMGLDEPTLEDWATYNCLEGDNATIDLGSLAFLLDSEGWP
ncbi:hypothetical protein L1049_018235 [Liquidambar formosana]|uniref:Myb-related protein 123 n=1 Tax=Liquidambar formosana TaxID=63359 RepID=A0AAP0R9T4_LIQFO